MENTNLQDLFDSMGFSEEDSEELSQYSYQTQGQIDDAIEVVKEIEVEKKRIQDLGKEKIEMIKFKTESMIKRLDNKEQWHLQNLREAVMAAGDAKETKTQFKKSYISGDIIIKKAEVKLIKPELTPEEIEETFPNYKKEKTEITLDWIELKKKLKIINGSVIHCETGEDLSSKISTELSSESVSVK